MRVKTSDLKSFALDYAVARIEYPDYKWGVDFGVSAHCRTIVVPSCQELSSPFYSPSHDNQLSGEIIDRENISSVYDYDFKFWRAYHEDVDHNQHEAIGTSRKEACMRCYVSMKLGKSVHIPKDLLGD